MKIKNTQQRGMLKRVSFFFVFTVVALSFLPKDAESNNLSLSDFSLYSVSTSNDTMTFTTNVSWDNSWRNITNYDAVWVFMKYSTNGGITWSHASMALSGSNPNGFSAPANFEIIVPADETGFFFQRTDLSTGSVNASNVRFVWDYGQDGLSDAVATAASTLTKLFAIEMVYVPQGSFYAGDGNSSSNYRFVQGSADSDPWYIQNENALSITNAVSNGYYYQSGGATGESATGSEFNLSASFPKGYKAFYLMKYELTEGQWVAFFNTLGTAEKANRDITSASLGGKNSDSIVYRNTVSWNSALPRTEASTSRPDRAMSYLSWPDVTAYADWAALRPVTELEYEKAARGVDVSALANEYAWGKTSINGAESAEIHPDADEDGAEAIWDGAANINNNGLSWSSGDGRAGGSAVGQPGPLRVGIFAESSTGRTTSGAGYYGNLDLSGNVAEYVVSVGKAGGRQFLGTHGDGRLTTLSGYEGGATNTDWPGINATNEARGVTGTLGAGYRGGDFQASSSREYQISDRLHASVDADSEGYAQRYDVTLGLFAGGRLGRTAP